MIYWSVTELTSNTTYYFLSKGNADIDVEKYEQISKQDDSGLNVKEVILDYDLNFENDAEILRRIKIIMGKSL